MIDLRNPFQGRILKQWSSKLPNLITLAAVFVFYMMLAMAFGITLGFGSILAATGAAIIAWSYAGSELVRKPDTGPGRTASDITRINP
jgi:hypothetical protein